MRHRPSLAFLAAVAIGACVAVEGCVAGEGKEPSLERFYFPTGLEQTLDRRFLYVVNSDFDLQYTGGTVQSVDLERVRAFVPRECSEDADCLTRERCDTDGSKGRIPSFWCVAKTGAHAAEPCGAFGEKTAAEQLLQPGRCAAVEPTRPQDGGSSLLVDEVKISAFATDALFRQRPAGADGSDNDDVAGRLFIPVRGDATLHWVDTKSDGTLDCGQAAGGECDERHKVGDRPAQENTRRLRLPPEPFGIASSQDGTVIVVTHPTQGALSLFENDWRARSTPRLQFVLGGLPSSPSGVALVPGPVGAPSEDSRANPEFLVDFRNAAELRLFRFFGDEQANPARVFLQQTGAVAITALANGSDSRGIAIDSAEREACGSACAPEADCATRCQDVPARLFVANRSPASLLVGEIEFIGGVAQPPQISNSIPLPFGPSRVVMGKVLDEMGRPVTRVFVVCFDSRRIGIYNPELELVETWVITGRGPHALVVDVGPREGSGPEYALAYVAHFTDSYVGVVQLDQRQPRTYGQMVVSLGKSSPPRSSK